MIDDWKEILMAFLFLGVFVFGLMIVLTLPHWNNTEFCEDNGYDKGGGDIWNRYCYNVTADNVLVIRHYIEPEEGLFYWSDEK